MRTLLESRRQALAAFGSPEALNRGPTYERVQQLLHERRSAAAGVCCARWCWRWRHVVHGFAGGGRGGHGQGRQCPCLACQ